MLKEIGVTRAGVRNGVVAILKPAETAAHLSVKRCMVQVDKEELKIVA